MGRPSQELIDFMKKWEVPRDDVWEVHGSTWVVKHKALERVAAKAGITWERPAMLECNSEKGVAALVVFGKLGEQMEWSIGEALIARDGVIGGNYKVTGKQAGYVYAMAEKRAKDRVILKLLNLHGSAYSEAEADEFSEERRQNPHVTRPEDILPKTEFGPNGEPIDNIPLADPGAGRKLPVKDQRPIFEALQKEIHATGSIIELQEWAEKNKNRLADLKPDWQEMLRGVYSEQINGLRNLARGDDMRMAG